MKTIVNKHAFIQAFYDMGRGDDFTPNARSALFDYFEELEQDCGMEIEFDPIAICCEWSEYEDSCSWANDYFTGDQRGEIMKEVIKQWEEDPSIARYGQDEFKEHWQEYLRDNTQVIEFNGGILVLAFQ